MMPASLFKQLLLPLYPRLHRVSLRLLGNVEDAEDMVQEVFLKLWDRRDALPDVQNVEAYCVTLTKNMCIDRLRLAEVKEVDVEAIALPLTAKTLSSLGIVLSFTFTKPTLLPPVGLCRI